MEKQWQNQDSARSMVSKYNSLAEELESLTREFVNIGSKIKNLDVNLKQLTPTDLGLGNVDNTSDLDKPVSRAQEEAIERATEPMLTSESAALIYEMPEYRRVTKEDVGLGEVDNTSDLNKPVSTATSIALNQAIRESKQYTDEGIANLIDGAPDTLDTLKEIADSMKNEKQLTKILSESIGTKASQSDLLAHTESLNNPHNVTKEQLGLGNVRNVEQIPQANLTASTEIENGGVYAMDAVQANPTVVGSLANKIRALAAIVTGRESGQISADNIDYDNKTSTISHTQVRRAIDELCYRIEGFESKDSTFNDDGSITVKIPYAPNFFGEKVTEFKDDGSIKDTFSLLELESNGDVKKRTVMKIKTTVFTETGITETVKNLVDYGPVSP